MQENSTTGQNGYDDKGPDTVPLQPPPLPPEDTVPVAPALAGPETHPFRFTGNAAEFFGIWIVNLFLTIITLGIYSAWAKVRKKRYFYGHTWVADANFEYHGDPIAILKGRLIAAAAFITYSITGHFMPKVAALLALCLFAAAPWFISRSMAFNAWNSSYRNIRFRFQATYLDVLKCIGPVALVLVFPLLMPDWDPASKTPPPTSFWVLLIGQTVTIMLVYPFIVGALKRLHVNHSQYGAAQFKIHAGIGSFYKIYFVTFLIAFGLVVVIGILAAVAAGVAAALGKSSGVLAALIAFAMMVAALIVYFSLGAVLMGYTRSRIGNLVFNTSHLDGQVSFESSLKMWPLVKIYLVNLLAIMFSFGLMIPWAVIRMMRYRAECLSLQSTSSLDEFIGGVSAQVGATGEELGEFFSIDLSL